MNLHIVKAAGGLVYRCTHKNSTKYQLLIVHRPKYDDWSLPKGKLISGESWEEAAIREVKEETGVAVKIGNFGGPVLYRVGDAFKLVLFWRMKWRRGTRFIPNSEVDKIEWVSFKEAMKKLTYPQEKELIDKIQNGG
jgi:8-oxo-(d)GTP phosphatase